jgi:nicotinamidase-related amidase
MPAIATIVIDMLNPYDHEDAEPLAENARSVIEPLSGLIAATRDADDAGLLYVNDNYEDYTATSNSLAENALNGSHPELIEPIVPPEGTPFLQKIRHSAFYGTPLEHALRQQGFETLVLAGQVTEQCILYSALDAYVRNFELRVASDAVAPIDPELGDAALKLIERNMGAWVGPAAEALRAG